MYLQGLLRILRQLPGDLPGQIRLDPAGHVQLGQLVLLVLRVLAQLTTLDVEFSLDQLPLRGDGGVLARGHREGTGGQAGETGDDDGLLAHRPAGHARHQGEVGDQAVHRAEDGGTQPAAVDVAVRVVVTVRHMQRGLGLDDGHDGSPREA
ncbi:hypothetical protein GCM10017687_91000 [Streptomyces echinatus]